MRWEGSAWICWTLPLLVDSVTLVKYCALSWWTSWSRNAQPFVFPSGCCLDSTTLTTSIRWTLYVPCVNIFLNCRNVFIGPTNVCEFFLIDKPAFSNKFSIIRANLSSSLITGYNSVCQTLWYRQTSTSFFPSTLLFTSYDVNDFRTFYTSNSSPYLTPDSHRLHIRTNPSSQYASRSISNSKLIYHVHVLCTKSMTDSFAFWSVTHKRSLTPKKFSALTKIGPMFTRSTLTIKPT